MGCEPPGCLPATLVRAWRIAIAEAGRTRREICSPAGLQSGRRATSKEDMLGTSLTAGAFSITAREARNRPQDRELHVADISNPSTRNEAASKVVGAINVPEPATRSKWYRWRNDGTGLVKYLLDSEVHTFAFSVAANAVLSFIPFIVLLYTLALSVFDSKVMVATINEMVKYFFPANQANQIVVIDILVEVANKSSRHGLQAFSLIMIIVACTGIFLPLEVALNQAWGIAKSRNYLANQVVAFGLAILMIVLGMASIILTTGVREVLSTAFFHHTEGGVLGFVYYWISFLMMAASTGVAAILFFFFIYWLLPNRKVPWRSVIRTAVITGVIWLVAKYFFMEFLLPHLHLADLYGGFNISVGLIFWAYVSGLILFAGAQFSVVRLDDKK
jgi:YihY family inner membrane protein